MGKHTKYDMPSGEMEHIPLPDLMERFERPVPVWVIVAFFVLALAGAIAFNLWLDSGCDITGAVTSEGKACV